MRCIQDLSNIKAMYTRDVIFLSEPYHPNSSRGLQTTGINRELQGYIGSCALQCVCCLHASSLFAIASRMCIMHSE